MTRRLPLVPTLLVGLAVAAMIALGIWQLQRRGEKEAAMVQYRLNPTLPLAAYPRGNPTDATYLFRRVSAYCLHVVSWRALGGQLPGGGSGWRQIAQCSTGAEGPGLAVDMGVSADIKTRPAWTGGKVTGVAVWEPDGQNALLRWLRHVPPPRLMIVSDAPAPGLAPAARPDPSDVPNNHLAYAVQWFLFAGVAVVIYMLALRRRPVGGDGKQK